MGFGKNNLIRITKAEEAMNEIMSEIRGSNIFKTQLLKTEELKLTNPEIKSTNAFNTLNSIAGPLHPKTREVDGVTLEYGSLIPHSYTREGHLHLDSPLNTIVDRTPTDCDGLNYLPSSNTHEIEGVDFPNEPDYLFKKPPLIKSPLNEPYIDNHINPPPQKNFTPITTINPSLPIDLNAVRNYQHEVMHKSDVTYQFEAKQIRESNERNAFLDSLTPNEPRYHPVRDISIMDPSFLPRIPMPMMSF